MANNPITVLSLFDGMSCGQLALRRAGFNVGNYFAAEIDKHAIKVCLNNFPFTLHVGDVRHLDGTLLPHIELIIGGSPCQSFSFAGKRSGMTTVDNVEILTLDHYLQLKSEGYQFSGQSYLFWEYVRLLKEVKPKYFLLENVLMDKKWENVISETLGVYPIEIDSALVSAQTRRRLYWTNINAVQQGLFDEIKTCMIPQPEDKKIYLKDIVQEDIDRKYFISRKMMDRIKRKHLPKDGRWSDETVRIYFPINPIPVGAVCFGRSDEAKAIRKANMKKGRDYSPQSSKRITRINPYKANTIMTKVETMVVQDIYKEIFNEDYRLKDDLSEYDMEYVLGKIRIFTPTESERLQTLPDGYTQGVSDTQRYKMVGNGWTVDAIAHILSYMKL